MPPNSLSAVTRTPVEPQNEAHAVAVLGDERNAYQPTALDFEEVPCANVKAQFAVVAGKAKNTRDVVVQLFLPALSSRLTPEESERLMRWWARQGEILSAVAIREFGAQFPQLQAAYIREAHSWWFRAHDFGHLVDLPGFARVFLQTLDKELQPYPFVHKIRSAQTPVLGVGADQGVERLDEG